MAMKKFYCVIGKFYDNGSTQAEIIEVFAGKKPANSSKEEAQFDVYCDYFYTKREAEKFAEEYKEA